MDNHSAPTTSLDLGVIGNCSIAALVDNRGRIVWGCFPRFDGDPVFCELVNNDGDAGRNRPAGGVFAIELEDFATSKVAYLQNTAVLSTVLHDSNGSALEIIDYVPRFTDQERIYRPQLLVRVVTPVSGRPRATVRLQPRFDYGATIPGTTRGTHHVRFVGSDQALRLTTTAPISYILEEKPFAVDRPLVFIFGNDERIPADIERTAREFLDRTINHWRTWVRSLSIPYDWQDEVIRAAITLKLCNFEETGAIVAALTTSIPEAPDTGRNWDYRYCWLRDAYFVIHALNQLGATRTMEDYIGFINDVVDDSAADRLRPVYSITRDSILDEWTAEALTGYRGNKPVRVGNAAYLQIQNDVYGSVVLASAHAFFDKRLIRAGDEQLFQRLETLGKQAVATFDQPDAGPWELRNTVRIHTFSSLMSWTACDRLAKIADCIGLRERAVYWRQQANRMHEVISKRAWNEELQSFVSVFNSKEIDATLLLIAELGFVPPDDPRFKSTVAQVQRRLCSDPFLFRYTDEDDFGRPATAFLICSFWLVNALFAMGKKDEARQYFQRLLSFRNPLGLLSEDIDPRNKELWGNFPQTYSMVGLINCAVKLSRRWDEVL